MMPENDKSRRLRKLARPNAYVSGNRLEVDEVNKALRVFLESKYITALHLEPSLPSHLQISELIVVIQQNT